MPGNFLKKRIITARWNRPNSLHKHPTSPGGTAAAADAADAAAGAAVDAAAADGRIPRDFSKTAERGGS